MKAITRQDIRDLQIEAGQAGDQAMVELCEEALEGDEEALRECAVAIVEAEEEDE